MRKEKVLTGGLVSLFIVSACLATGQVHWLLNDQPVFGPGPPGVWDNGSIIGFCVVRNGDRYVVYYDSGAVGIGRATSSDGLVWQREPTAPVLARGPDLYDAKYIWGPAVVADPDGYKMWYTSSDPDNTWTISLAVSHDGVEWVKCPSNPVLRVDLPDKVGDPWVIWEDGLYKMWYTHYNRSLGHFVIDYATSPDGVEWRRYERNPVLAPSESGPDSSSVRDPCVIRTDNGYGMWYRGIGLMQRNWTICYASSTDGVTWTKHEGNPVLGGQEDTWLYRLWFPRVVRGPDGYSMWFTSRVSGEVGYAFYPISESLFLALGALIAWGASRIQEKAL